MYICILESIIHIHIHIYWDDSMSERGGALDLDDRPLVHGDHEECHASSNQIPAPF